MFRVWFGAGMAAFLLALAGSAFAEPRLERERCTFKPPRGERIECYALIVPENREQPKGREVRLQVAVLKAKRPLARDPLLYLAGGPGEAPLVASNAGADPLAEGGWWTDTATIRRRRDIIIMDQRGAGGATPSLDCFEPRTSDPARARRRAVTEQQERDILLRCRADFDKKKVDLAMYTTPVLADDVADLAKAFSLTSINLYGISYGTRWALETMRRHPGLVRAVVLDGVYPPSINGEQNEPEIVRNAFEKLYAECAAVPLCHERNPDPSSAIKEVIAAADRAPLAIDLQLDDGPRAARLDGSKVMMVLLHMMREGEAALLLEAVSGIRRGDLRLIEQFAEDFENDEGGLLEQNAQQFGGLFNTIECRESWAAVDQAARDRSIEAGGIYSLSAQQSKLAAFCPVWRVPVAPPAERQPVKSSIPTLLLSGVYDWLTPPEWGKEAAKGLENSHHVVFRALGHGVSTQDVCAARLRDEFIEDPNPRAPLPCRPDMPPDFADAAERVRALP
ncbi:MAG: alpha/beta hydrolase [Reyranellales bacterium]